MLYSLYPKLDVLIIYLEEVGIKSITSDEYHGYITFNDDTEFEFWNENKWFAWMKSGTIKFSNNKELKWSDRRPSFEALYKYKKVIKKYEKSKNVDNNDYTEYLPIKVIRKAKLKKLK